MELRSNPCWEESGAPLTSRIQFTHGPVLTGAGEKSVGSVGLLRVLLSCAARDVYVAKST